MTGGFGVYTEHEFRAYSEDDYIRRPVNFHPARMEMKKKNHNKAFGAAIRAVRMKQGITQETLGFEAGLDRTYVSMVELGSSSPTLDTMMALSGALGIPLTDIIADMLLVLNTKKA